MSLLGFDRNRVSRTEYGFFVCVCFLYSQLYVS